MRDCAGIMEIGSDSLGCAPGSGDLLNGIKLGERIYFENAGSVVNCSPSGPVVAEAASSLEQDRSSSKKGRGVTVASQPPRCQVEGCNVDLTGLKAYYCRHKVCGMHSKFPKVIVGGLEQRFCQQCSRFHLLAEFDQGKRSCRRRLAGHNERRRKPHSSSLVSPNFAHVASFLREDGSRMRGFWDYPYSRLPAGQTVWHSSIPVDHGTCNEVTSTVKFLPNVWQGSFNSSTMAVSSSVPQPYLQNTLDWISVPASNARPSECFAPVSASGGALSLLSTEPHSRRARSFGLNGYGDGHSFASQESVLSNTTTMSGAWSFRGRETEGSSDDSTLQQLPSSCNSDRFQMNWSL